MDLFTKIMLCQTSCHRLVSNYICVYSKFLKVNYTFDFLSSLFSICFIIIRIYLLNTILILPFLSTRDRNSGGLSHCILEITTEALCFECFKSPKNWDSPIVSHPYCILKITTISFYLIAIKKVQWIEIPLLDVHPYLKPLLKPLLFLSL